MDEVIIVASTHWDREWYRSFAEFRVRLCELFERLLPLLEDGAVDCYTFDGQSVVLEDYLEVYPENRDRIARLVREGRLAFGPLYNLPDEFLSGGETLIRNFLAGDEICSRIGGKCRAGYVPDNFGHVSQLPQILRGCGIDTAFLFRGLDLSAAGHREFRWRAPDGSEVMAELMPLGYWSLKGWGRMGKSAAEQFLEACHTLEKAGALGCILLINGSDHLFQDPELPRLLAEARKALPGVSIRNASLQEYAELLVKRGRASPEKLTEIRGELRDFRSGPDPTAVSSTRYGLKRRLFAARGELLRYAEPLAAWAWVLGHDYPGGILNHAWKDILKALGHDGLSGCSSDAVSADIAAYLRHAGEAAARITALSLEKIFPVSRTGTTGDAALIAFNPLSFPFTGVLETEAALEDAAVRDFVLLDETGKALEWEYLASREETITREFEYNSKERVVRRCFNIRFWVDEIPPLSARIFTLRPSRLREFRRKELAVRLAPGENVIQNEYYAVEVQPDAALRVRVKKTGRVYPGLNLFVSRGEAGDTYQHVSPLADEHTFPVLTGLSVRRNSTLAEELVVRGTLQIPAAAAEDFLSRKTERVSCEFESAITLFRQSPLIEVRVTFDNRAADHILFAAFPLPGQGVRNFSQIAFDEVYRDEGLYEFRPELKSTPSILHPFEMYAGLGSADGGFILTARGLHEYHVKSGEKGTVLYLTLLRSTSWMFHGIPHNWQDGQHSTTPIIETPEAREPGTHIFEYAFSLDTDRPLALAERYRFPPRCAVIRKPPENRDRRALPDLSGLDGRIGFSALKKWRLGEGLLLRLFNGSDDTVPLVFGVGEGTLGVSLADLLENPLEEIPIRRGIVSLNAGPRRIISLILRRT
jgi:hypothetical protein